MSDVRVLVGVAFTICCSTMLVMTVASCAHDSVAKPRHVQIRVPNSLVPYGLRSTKVVLPRETASLVVGTAEVKATAAEIQDAKARLHAGLLQGHNADIIVDKKVVIEDTESAEQRVIMSGTPSKFESRRSIEKSEN